MRNWQGEPPQNAERRLDIGEDDAVELMKLVKLYEGPAVLPPPAPPVHPALDAPVRDTDRAHRPRGPPLPLVRA